MAYKLLSRLLPVDIVNIVFDYQEILAETYLKKYIITLALRKINAYIWCMDFFDDYASIKRCIEGIKEIKKMNNYDIWNIAFPAIDYMVQLHDMKIIVHDIDTIFDVLLTERIIKTK